MKTWVQKYHPKNLGQITGQQKAVSEAHRFWRNFRSNVKNAILLYGPPGCGKTSFVYALAEQESLELVE